MSGIFSKPTLSSECLALKIIHFFLFLFFLLSCLGFSFLFLLIFLFLSFLCLFGFLLALSFAFRFSWASKHHGMMSCQLLPVLWEKLSTLVFVRHYPHAFSGANEVSGDAVVVDLYHRCYVERSWTCMTLAVIQSAPQFCFLSFLNFSLGSGFVFLYFLIVCCYVLRFENFIIFF